MTLAVCYAVLQHHAALGCLNGIDTGLYARTNRLGILIDDDMGGVFLLASFHY